VGVLSFFGARFFLTLLGLSVRPFALFFRAFLGYAPMSLVGALPVSVSPIFVLSRIVGHGDEVSAWVHRSAEAEALIRRESFRVA
jgi:hypothetical protein